MGSVGFGWRSLLAGIAFPLATITVTAVTMSAFWPTYFVRLTRETFRLPWIVHLHALIFTAFLLLLLVQMSVATIGWLRVHRSLGQLGVAYGAVVFTVGVAVAIGAPVLHVHAGEWTHARAAGSIVYSLSDMALFAGFFGAAMFWRQRLEWHRPLIVGAAVTIAFAATGRPPIVLLPEGLRVIVWLSPMLIIVGLELAAGKRPNAVTWISLFLLVAAWYRGYLLKSALVVKVGRAVLEAFLW